MCCGGILAEENYQCGVVYALRIREATSFSLKKDVYLYLTEAMERMQKDTVLN